VLEKAWIKASGFPTNARKTEVINEISHLDLVGDPIEVDENSLKSGDVIRVKVMCMEVYLAVY
jgi:hypothetical protein